MAYRKRFRRGYRRFRSYSRSRGGSGLIMSAAGVGVGFIAPTVVPFQDLAVTLLAVAPVKMPRTVRRVAGGYVIGRILKSFVGTGSTDINTNYV